MWNRNLKTLFEGKKQKLQEGNFSAYCKAVDWSMVEDIEEKVNLDSKRKIRLKDRIKEEMNQFSIGETIIETEKNRQKM